MKISSVINYSLFYQTDGAPEEGIRKILPYNVENVILFLVAIRNCFRSDVSNALKFKLVQSFLFSLPQHKAKRLLVLLKNQDAGYFLITNIVINNLLLDLFRHLPQSTTSEESLNDSQFSEDILDVILSYNETHYASQNIGKEPDSPELIWKLMLMQDVNATDEVNFARTSAPKHLIFLHFIRIFFNDRQFKKLNKFLTDNHRISNAHEFFATIINVYIQLTNMLKDGNTLIKVAPSEPAYDLLVRLDMVLEKHTVSQKSFDIGDLTTKPFFRASDQNLYLVDHSDFALLTEMGWMYSLFKSGAIGALKPKVKGLNNYLSLLGKEYYEKHLLGTIFDELSGRGISVLKSDDQHLPDLSLIINEKDIFVIEIKSSTIHYRTIYEQNVEEFKDFIDKQFAVGKKGVTQLVRNIAYLAHDKHKMLNIRNKPEKLTVIPIIIFTEYHLDIPAVNSYVNEKFITTLGDIGKPFKEVLPLTMIHYDFFIENIRLLKNDRSLLKRLIRDYWRNSRKKTSEYEKFKSTFNYMQSQISFDRHVIGNEGVYRVDHKAIFSDMTDIFRLREDLGES